jgi:hypothetical protein
MWLLASHPFLLTETLLYIIVYIHLSNYLSKTNLNIQSHVTAKQENCFVWNKSTHAHAHTQYSDLSGYHITLVQNIKSLM